METKTIKAALRELKKSVETKDQSQISSRMFFRGGKAITSDSEVYTEIPGFDFPDCDVNFKDFTAFIAGAGDSVSLSIIDGQVVGESDGERVTFGALEVEPNAASKLLENWGKLDSLDVKINIPEDIFAAIDRGNPKFELNGMLVDFRKGKIVATDTRRLVVHDIPMLDRDSIIITKKALTPGELVIGGVFKRVEDATYAKAGDVWGVSYSINGINKRSRTINGKFPDWERVVPNSFLVNVKFNGLEVKEYLKKSNDVAIRFKDDKMTIKKLPSGGQKSFDCDYPSGDGIEIVFDGGFIWDAIGENEANIQMNGWATPAKIGNSIIMPITNSTDRSNYHEPKYYNSTFQYSETKKKKRAPSAAVKLKEKDARIAELEAEVSALRAELSKYSDAAKDAFLGMNRRAA